MQNGTVKKCHACGEEILATAKKCKHCGEWLEAQHRQAVAITGRTESMVSQVAPQHENEYIRFREGFGWNLSGRQEMVVEGETKVNLDWNRNLVASTDVSKYVKLHFTRSLDLPNLSQIRELERQFDQTKIPQMKGLRFAAITLLVTGALSYVSFSERGMNDSAVFYLGVAVLSALCLLWKISKNSEIRVSVNESLQKRAHLVNQSKSLLAQ